MFSKGRDHVSALGSIFPRIQALKLYPCQTYGLLEPSKYFSTRNFLGGVASALLSKLHFGLHVRRSNLNRFTFSASTFSKFRWSLFVRFSYSANFSAFSRSSFSRRLFSWRNMEKLNGHRIKNKQSVESFGRMHKLICALDWICSSWKFQ